MIDFLEEEHMRREVFTTRRGGHKLVRSTHSFTDPSYVSDVGGSQVVRTQQKSVGAEQDSSIVSVS